MTQEEKTKIEERIVDVLKTVYDPEIPVNIYDLGMIYKIDVQDYSADAPKDDEDGPKAAVELDMTFTAPNCPAADYILEDVRTKVESVEGVKSSNVNLVFEPAWDQSMMSEEARVELGFDWTENWEVRTERYDYMEGWWVWWKEKEADETLYWIKILHNGEYINEKEYESIYNDADELVKLLVSSIKTLKQKNGWL